MINTCGIFLITPNWKTLIGKSSRHGSHQLYSIPKGKADDGEEFLTAALRELYEEANVTINPSNHVIHTLPPIKYERKLKTLNAFFITGILEEDYPDLICNSFIPNGEPELTDLEWRTLLDCKTLLHPTQARAIESIEEYLLSKKM